jgi:hypothetical protein
MSTSHFLSFFTRYHPSLTFIFFFNFCYGYDKNCQIVSLPVCRLKRHLSGPEKISNLFLIFCSVVTNCFIGHFPCIEWSKELSLKKENLKSSTLSFSEISQNCFSEFGAVGCPSSHVISVGMDIDVSYNNIWFCNFPFKLLFVSNLAYLFLTLL